ncbi:MAG: hypothetical protein KKA19_05035 [Candidatus Margulisbacteria bacterium]|nr:hypothetical protein [Candidatus Margulisiibacteriota bacterium]
MKKLSILSLILLVIFNSGCGQVSKNLDVKDGNNSGYSTVTDEYAINNNLSALAIRTTNENTTLDVSGTSDIILKQISELAPPLYQDEVLQATDIEIKGKYVYISYNTQGEEKRGGVQILFYDGSKLQVISEMVLFNADVHALKVDEGGNVLYLAESVESDNPACLEILELKQNQIVGSLGRVALPSYAAVDVDTIPQGGYVYVVYGDKNGGVAKIDKKTLKVENTYSADDIRSVNAKGDDLYILQGCPAVLKALDKHSLSLLWSKNYSGLNIPESKAVVDYISKVVVFSAGDAGSYIVNSDSGEELLHFLVPQGDINSGDAVCNSISFDGDLLFLANGSAGVEIVQLDRNMEAISSEVNIVSRGSLKTNSSVNMVAYDDKLLFVTAGWGGIKVIAIN